MARISKAQIAANEAAAAATAEAQRIELARMRKAKRDAAKQAKLAAAAHVEAVQPEALHADIDALVADLPLPSAKRVIIGILLGLAASFSVGYAIGLIMVYAIAGIMVLTSSPALAFCLSVLAWIISFIACWKIGGFVGGKVFASVVMPEGLASRSYESVANAVGATGSAISGAVDSVKSRVTGWFTSAPVVEFTGAHTA